MARKKKPARRKLSRADVRVLVIRHLGLAGDRGLTTQELLTEIGDEVSYATLRRALDELRSVDHDAQIVSFGKVRRWRLLVPLAMPLEAPDDDDRLAVTLAQSILKPYIEEPLYDRIGKIHEDLDERGRNRGSATDPPARRAMTSTLTLGTKTDPDIFRRLFKACRRKTVRIRYASPWRSFADGATWYEIEPWALRMHDGAVYLRAWAINLAAARTFRVTHVDECDEVDPPTNAASRQTPPENLWGEEDPAYGIDHDRPSVAVIRLGGAVARWVARTTWHPAQDDKWLVPGELLERTFPYRSCRELARRIASVHDGVESIEPEELCDEVVALGARLATLQERSRRVREARRSLEPL